MASVLSQASAFSGTGTCTVSRPSGATSGDVLLAVQFCDNDTTATLMTAPAGFTQRYLLNVLYRARIKVWSKTATSSEAASYTFASGRSDAQHAVTMLRCTNVDPSDPVASSGGTTNTGSSISAPSVTPSSADDYQVVGVAGLRYNAADAGNAFWATPSGFTEHFDEAGVWMHPATFGRELSSSGGTGSVSLSASVSFGAGNSVATVTLRNAVSAAASGQVTTTGPTYESALTGDASAPAALAGALPSATGTAAAAARSTGEFGTDVSAATGTLAAAAATAGELVAGVAAVAAAGTGEITAAGETSGSLPAVELDAVGVVGGASALAAATTTPTGNAVGAVAAPGQLNSPMLPAAAGFTAAVGSAGSVTAEAPHPAAQLDGVTAAAADVNAEAPAATTELAGDVLATGEVDLIGSSAASALTGSVGRNRLDGTLAAPTTAIIGIATVTGEAAATLPTVDGALVGDNDNDASLVGNAPAVSATVTGDVTVTGTLTGSLPAPALSVGIDIERDISLVANLAPAAWHSTVADAEWRVLLAADEWTGALQAAAWLAGVDASLWAVSDVAPAEWAGALHAAGWAAAAAAAEWTVSTPWITNPGEAGPGMRLNSKEFVKVTVTPSKDPGTGQPIDISTDEVEMCVTIATHPEEVDWQPAAWVGSADPTSGALACRLLVQPSALGLTTNSQPSVFVRVHDNPEIPVLKAGQLSIN